MNQMICRSKVVWWDGSKEEEKQSTTEGVEGRGASALYRAAGVDTGSTRQSSTTRQVALLLFFFFPHSFFLNFFSPRLILRVRFICVFASVV